MVAFGGLLLSTLSVLQSATGAQSLKDVALQNKVFEGSRQTGIVSSQEDFSRSLSELGAAFRMKLGVKAGFVFVLARLGPTFCGVCACCALGSFC